MRVNPLVFDTIDLNRPEVVRELLKAVQDCLTTRSVRCPLLVKPPYYFSTPHVLPKGPGWYVILDAQTPIYVGETDNLNSRLNTNHGSLDDFANSQRASDVARNIIKKLAELTIINDLRVIAITESDVLAQMDAPTLALGQRDRRSVEKLIGLFRCTFHYP